MQPCPGFESMPIGPPPSPPPSPPFPPPSPPLPPSPPPSPPPPSPPPGCVFPPGDANGDNIISVTDAVVITSVIVLGTETAQGAFCSADIDGNGVLEVSVSAALALALALAERGQSLSMGG